MRQLADNGKLNSQEKFLRDIGFSHSFAFGSRQAFDEALVRAAQEALDSAAVQKEDVRRLFLYHGLEAVDNPQGDTVLDAFVYPVTSLRHKLDIPNASAIALSQQGCSGLLTAIDMAGTLLQSSEDDDAILCIAGDMLPMGGKREIIYNVMSDAAGAVIVSRNAQQNFILAYHQEYQDYYWNTPKYEEEILASYFPLAQKVIRKTLSQAGLTPQDIDWIIPHNVSVRSWEILSRLVDIPSEKVWAHNVSKIGHTVSCDHIINLQDMQNQNVLKSGDVLLLFTFGFGASWSCMILEH